MAYRVILKPSAERALDKLPKQIQARVVAKTAALAETPRPSGSVKLAGQQDAYRIRVGDYRIVYEIDDQKQIVFVTIIAHRRESYRGL